MVSVNSLVSKVAHSKWAFSFLGTCPHASSSGMIPCHDIQEVSGEHQTSKQKVETKRASDQVQSYSCPADTGGEVGRPQLVI